MKKIITILFCIMALVFALSLTSFAASTTSNAYADTIDVVEGVPEPTVIDKNAKAVVKVNDTYYTIPTYYLIADNTVFTWSVHENVKSTLGLGKDVRSNLIRIQIPEGIVSINPKGDGGATAMESSASLVEVSIPSSLTLLGHYAFNKCSNLETITGLEEYFATRATAVPPLVVAGTKWGTNIDLVIKEGITSIGNDCFNGTKIKSVKLPSTLETLGGNAFANCKNITSVKIPASLKTLSNHVFANCTSLTTVDVSGCTQIQTIGRYCFEKSGITSFDFTPFAANMTSISEGLFNGCTSLTTVTGYELVTCATAVGENMFNNAPISALKFPPNIETIGSYAFYGYNGSIKEIVIPDAVKTIGSRAFASTAITKVVLPSSLTTLSNHVFANCSSLVTIDISKCTLLSSIGEYCFENCSNITELDFRPFAANLTKMDTGVFNGCKKLASVPGFENATGLSAISGSTFKSCPLTEIKLPANITSIGGYAFYGHKSTQAELRIPNGVTTIGDHAFTRGSSGGQGTKVYLSADLTTISENYTFEDWQIAAIYIPAGVTSIPAGFCNRGLSAGAVFFYTGNKNGFTISGTNNSVIANAEWISASDYTGPSTEKNYIVYGYSACEAFYYGVHMEADTTNGSACYLADCSRCNVEKKDISSDATHNLNSQYVYANGYMAAGQIISICQNAGCKHGTEATAIVSALDALFNSLEYSVAEKGFGICVKYNVNKDALAVYKNSGKSISFGVVAVMADKVEGNGPLANNGELTTQKNVIAADVTADNIRAVTLRISGNENTWKSNATKAIYILGYATNGTDLEYLGTASGAQVDRNNITSVKSLVIGNFFNFNA